jgi:hypothetical protein
VEEFDRVGPWSFSYPVKKNLTASLDGPFTFSVRRFASIMDDVLKTLDGACYVLPEIAGKQAEAAYEAMQNSEPPYYESD